MSRESINKRLVSSLSQRLKPSTDTKKGKLVRALAEFFTKSIVPILGIAVFLFLWAALAKHVDTSLGQFPDPTMVVQQAVILVEEHREERTKAEAFYERQKQRNQARLAADPSYAARIRDYPGKETFFDQIKTSLFTVMSGFLLAAIIGIPFGIALGLSSTLKAAMNPLIQVFKPVSPLAWLPLVTMLVSALYVSDDPSVPKSYLNSLFTVALCCIWPMVINTSLGVTSIDKDLVNVSRILNLSSMRHVQKIVLPATVPFIFTGMRLALGVAWMVLIAAEMLAQNPGLGKFVWDEFQNGSSSSLSRIMVAVFVIGFIGFLLDRTMLAIQKQVSWNNTAH